MKPVAIFLSAVAVVVGQSCVTPNGEKATCLSLLKCPVLTQAVQDYSTHAFIEASTCAGGRLMVCCGTLGKFASVSTEPPVTPSQSQESPRDYALREHIPSRRVCGLQHTDDYNYNDTATSVDEFPWLVYFVQQQDYVNSFYLRKESNCVGVLISRRHVLTLYHECLSTTEFKGGLNHTIEMLFGQHHIYKNVSCIPTNVGVEDCSLPVVREVSYTWQQKHYTSGPTVDNTVISVVRLNQTLGFTDYLRPICLPLKEDDFPHVGDTIFSSGWGEPTYVNGKNVKLKKRVKYTLMNDEECEAGNPLDNPVCGVPLDDNVHVVCPGDNGGPLMYKTKTNWFVTGLISVPSCGDIRPVTAEKLTSAAVDWILTAVGEIELKQLRLANNNLS